MPTPGQRQKAYQAVIAERDYQDSKWSYLDRSVKGVRATNTLPDFLGYLRIQSNSALASNVTDTESTLHTIRKIAALGVAAMELFGMVKREGKKFWKLGISPTYQARPNFSEVFRVIDAEREYQDNLRARRCKGLNAGNTIDKNPTSLGAYLTMFRFYLAECDRAWTQKPGDNACLDELRKLTALAIRAMEEHGIRGRVEPQAKTHLDTPK